jgi:hypothetical protein
MPINPNARTSPQPEPDDAAAREQGLPTTEDAKTMDADSTASEPAKRKRRTKDERIADAVVPDDDENVALKDIATGAKIERPWIEAVALVESEKAEFADKGMKYARIKYAQQQAPSASQEPAAPSDQAPPATDAFGRPSPEQLEAAQLPTDESGQMVAPEGASHGDEVVIGAKTYFVGPTGVLVDGVVDAPARRRWQRELGAGSDGPWESQPLRLDALLADEKTSAPVENNGHYDQPPITVQNERLPRTVEPLDNGMVKIGTGILEKIGLPDYSSFHVGPITISRQVFDDGRRTVVPLGDGREGEVITAAVEGFELLDNTVEFIAARFRGQLRPFLQATGAQVQPVS